MVSRVARVASSTLVLIAMAGLLYATPPAFAAPVSRPSLAPGIGSTLHASWLRLLGRSQDLGPSQSKTVSVLAQLRGAGRPRYLERWAAGMHLRVQWSSGEQWAVLSGPASGLSQALGVRIDDYRSPAGRPFYGARAIPAVPAPLEIEVAAFGQISSYLEMKPFDVPSGGLTPTTVMRAYDAGPLAALNMKGQGRTVVLFELGGFSQRDLNHYTSHFGLPGFSIGAIGPHMRSVDGETELDIEAVHDIAPDAHIVVVNFNVQTAAQMVGLFHTVASSLPGAIWSFSLGQCETETGFSSTDFSSIDAALLDAEGRGTTIFASSGDAGGLDCTPYQDFGNNPRSGFVGVNVPASFPPVTGVGGTSLSTTANGSYVAESSWTEPLLSQGTGGGISQIWNPPCWQVAPGTGDFYGATPGRQVPDVAAVADPATGLWVYSQGSAGQIGGTSLAAPVWAGFAVLIDQYLHTKGKPSLGEANPYLYRLASRSQHYPPFHDVKTGGNAVYPAATGYDMATGLGSPNVWNLAQDLVPMVGSQVC